MKINSRVFGTIDVEDEKILDFQNGIIGEAFSEYRYFTLITQDEKKKMSLLQSVDDPDLAFPVMDPLLIMEDYKPTVEDEFLGRLGELTSDNFLVLVIVKIPENAPELSTANLKAPIVINTDTKKGCQIIVEEDYSVKHPVFQKTEAVKGDE